MTVSRSTNTVEWAVPSLAWCTITFVLVLHTASGQKIKNWEAQINFNVGPEELPKMLKEPEQPNRVHDFLKTFTFSHERHIKQLLSDEAEFSSLRQSNQPLHSNDSTTPVLASISQDFDHFSDAEERKWDQYFYYTNLQDEESSTRNLNFLLLEGEGGFTERSISPRLFFVASAKRFGATAYSLEHRFYSANALLNSVTPQRLGLLTSEQALADAAVFIANINRERRLDNPKWIVFGGSYPGNLAAWFRQKYPHLVHAAIASSAPVETKTNFYEYMQVVESAYRRFGFVGCAENIEKFFTVSSRLIQTPEGRRLLNVCDKHGDVNHFEEHDLELYFSSHIGRLSTAVQYDDLEHRALNKTCHFYEGELARLESLERASRSGAKQIRGGVAESPCQQFSFQYDMEWFARYKTLTYYWYWQTCTELGYFQSSHRGYSNYSVLQDALTVNFFVDMCTVMFGPEHNRRSVDEAVRRNHQIYGGASGYDATNVLFINGNEDPWHVLSVLEDRATASSDTASTASTTKSSDSTSLKSHVIDGTSHCKDMYTLAEGQQHWGISEAHRVATEHLQKWIDGQ